MSVANEIWVLLKFRDAGPTRTGRQLLAAAGALAREKDLKTVALSIAGAPYETTRHLAALWRLIESRGRPRAILASAGADGLELMPRLAARLRCGYAGSAVALRWEGDRLAATRPVYGGRAYEEVVFVKTPALATLRPGAWTPPQAEKALEAAETLVLDAPPVPGPVVIEHRATASATVDLGDASRVVAGGRGLGSGENFRLIEELAGALGAAVAASRAVVDAGWRPHDEQVGKSGRTICPDLYIACGISGAVHHVLGMNTSRLVVAINSDAEAPIFKHADYGLVGNALQVLPELIRALKPNPTEE